MAMLIQIGIIAGLWIFLYKVGKVLIADLIEGIKDFNK